MQRSLTVKDRDGKTIFTSKGNDQEAHDRSYDSYIQNKAPSALRNLVEQAAQAEQQAQDIEDARINAAAGLY